MKARGPGGTFVACPARMAAKAAGQRHYISSDRCAYGHEPKRFVSNNGCAECLRLSCQKYLAANREKLRLKKLEWAKKNPVKNAAQSIKWQAENPAKAYAIQTRAKKARPDYYRAIGRIAAAKRRSRLMQRTPQWSSLREIAEIYRNCPDGMEVDHIYPLQGRKVSGLHVPANLQYLTKSENCRKGNRHEDI